MSRIARLCATCIALALLLTHPRAASAKSGPDLMRVTGPGLAAPVEIADQATLAPFNPWNRGFIAWDHGIAATPPPLSHTSTVTLYLEAKPIFVLHYAPNPNGGPGYLYVPGPTDEWYRLNISTIITGDSDRWNPNGKWHYATREWDAAMQQALSTRVSGASQIGSFLLPAAGGAPLRRPDLLVVLSVTSTGLGAFAAFALRPRSAVWRYAESRGRCVHRVAGGAHER